MVSKVKPIGAPNFVPKLIFRDILAIEFRNVSPHLETALEIHDRWPLKSTYVFAGHLLSGNEGYSIPPPLHTAPELIGLNLLRNTSEHTSYQLRSIPVFDSWLERVSSLALDDLSHAQNINDIKTLKHAHLNYGMAFASQLISHSKSLNPDPNLYRKYLQDCHNQYFTSYAIAQSLIQTHLPQALLIFNGRFSPERALTDIADHYGLSKYYHERTFSNSNFFLAPYQSHDFPRRHVELREALSLISSEHIDERELDSLYFKQRAGLGVLGTTFSSPPSQLIPSLTDGLNADTANSLIFCTSSDDEFSALDDQPMYPYWKSQKSAILQIMHICVTKSIRFILRVHPNIRNKALADQNTWLELCTTVRAYGSVAFDHFSSVSTYDLINTATYVVTSGSMVGIEALALGRKTAVIRECPYSDLPGIYSACDESSFNKFLAAKRSNSISLISSRAYALWALRQGVEHHLLAYDHRGITTFKGRYLRSWHNRYYSLLLLKRSFNSWFTRLARWSNSILLPNSSRHPLLVADESEK